MTKYLLSALASLAACLAQTHPRGELQSYNDEIGSLIRRVAPSVVQILVSGYGPQADIERRNTGVVIGRQRAMGSGFVLGAEGYIMTNAHVVSGADNIRVVFPATAADNSNGTEDIARALSSRTSILTARVVGVARDLDIALLKVETGPLTPLPLAPYRDLRQGEMVFAFGSPEGLRNTVTHGVVSAVARQNEPDSPQISIQTDAAINPGNSGGPLVNIKGEVVGMDTFILSQSGGNEGLGFAIPSATIRVAYRQLRLYGRLRRQEIGVGLQTITPAMSTALRLPRDYGVIISDAMPGGPAAGAGIKPGDVLLSVDKQPAENLPTVSYYFLLRDSGEKVHIELLRGGEKLAFDVPVIEEKHDIDGVLALASPENNLVPEIGILGVELDRRLAALVPGLRHPYGIIVAARTSGASRDIPALPGDVIVALNGQPTTTLDSLRTALKMLNPSDPVTLQIEREGRLMYLTFARD